MQTKTTVRYHPTHVTVAIFKKVSDNKCWQGCGEKRTLVQSWWEGNLVQTVENSMEGPQKIKNRTTT